MTHPVEDTTRPGRGRLIWGLIGLALLPALAAGLFRAAWDQLPQAVRWTSYVLSGIAALVVGVLIITDRSPDEA